MSAYAEQLEEKKARLLGMFAPFGAPELEVFESSPEHYRMRAEFRLWHDGDALDYVMYDQTSKQRYAVHTFPAASEQINALMPVLIEKVRPCQILRRRIFQVDFLSTLSGEILVTMLYHRKLDEEWIEAASALRSALRELGFAVDIVGRARKQKIVLERDFVIEELHVAGRMLRYQQVENSFTQPNAQIAEKMLEWALSCVGENEDDLLELYCGNGNFSIALAPQFRKVLATEVSKSSVNSAQYNIAENACENVAVIRLSAEELTEAVTGQREFRRLAHAGVELADYHCQTVLVDPPRAGMDAETTAMVQQYEKILYISCNPQTLLENLETLSQTHRIERIAMFDQFPFTHHIESGVYLVKK